MKKALFASMFLGLALPVFAQSSGSVVTGGVQIAKTDSQGENMSFGASEISRNNKETMCWAVQTTPNQIGKMMTTTEVYKLPAKGVFRSSGNSSITSSADKKTWIITETQEVRDESVLMKCWTMSKEDPKGLYTLTVTVNGEEQAPVTFKVVD